MGKTKIEWATKVWNPITGCTKISEGCRNCYAFRMSKRLAGRYGYPKDNPFAVTFHPERLNEPLHWKKPQKIFVCSMGDLFHKDVLRSYIGLIWRTMQKASQHTFLVLTKRADRIAELLKNTSVFPTLPNVWLIVSVEDQKTADERIPLLLQTPAAKRGVSYEPALGPVDFSEYLPKTVPPDHANGTGYMTVGLDWLIMGGESGSGARPMHLDWARKVRDDCKAAKVAFFMKQMSEKAPIPKDLMIREFPGEVPKC